MRKAILLLLIISIILYANNLYAYWVWTPESSKWVNPKYAVKDTAEEQFEWANHFYETADYDKAIREFDKLIRVYPNSKYASKAQYFIGHSYEDKEEYYHAFLAYQKSIDTYPHIKNREEVIAREYEIGLLFYGGQKAKILGINLLPATDKAIEIFENVASNDPYGKYADKAQFKIAECYSKDKRFGEAVMAFQKLIDEHPKSKLVEKAKYEVAHATYKASLDPDYDQEVTEEAIEEFEEFIGRNTAESLSVDAEKVLNKLKEKKAQSMFDIAQFYEKQRHFASAAVYYKEITEKYPDTSVAAEALSNYMKVEKRAKEIEEKKAFREARKLRSKK